MKLRNIARKFGTQIGVGSALVLGMAGSAMADVAEATAALDTASSDVNAIGWAATAVLIGAAAFKYMRRAF